MKSCNDAKKTIREIAADIINTRGDVSSEHVLSYGRAYTHWRAACEPLTLSEINEAILDGRRITKESGQP